MMDDEIEKLVDDLWGATFMGSTATVGQREECKACYREILKDSLRAEPRQAAFDAMLEALKTISKAPLYEEPLDPDHAVGLIARHNHAVRLASNTVYAIEEKTRSAIALAVPTTHTERSA